MKRSVVLFVDDEENLLSTFRRLFRREPFDALFANSGKEALSILATEEVDLMVTDQRMPNMDGLTLFKESQKKHKSLKVIVLSGDSDVSKHSSELNKNGLCGIYQKPIDCKILLEKIFELID